MPPMNLFDRVSLPLLCEGDDCFGAQGVFSFLQIWFSSRAACVML